MAFDPCSVALTPLWTEGKSPPPDEACTWSGTADVVVVGSGYAGLMAAIHLAEAGRAVTVIEAGDLGTGASTRNGGAVGATLRFSLGTLCSRLGEEAATRLWREAVGSRAFIEHFISHRGIDCGYARRGRFIGAHRKGDFDLLARDNDLRRARLGECGEMVSRDRQTAHVGTERYHGGRFMPQDGNLDPRLLHDGLVKTARRAGVRLVPRCRALGVSADNARAVVTTDRGNIGAGAAVIATNAYTGREFGFLRRRLIPIQSQIIATEPLAPEVADRIAPGRAQLGDTCRLHNYYRLSPDGTRLLFGGRSGASQVDDYRKSGAALHRRMTALFPYLRDARITHSWGGMIAFTFDQLPHMQACGSVHFIGGCCGSGIAMMSWLGYRTARKILGDPELSAFDRPFRSQPLYTGNPWFMPAIVAALEVRDRLRI